MQKTNTGGSPLFQYFYQGSQKNIGNQKIYPPSQTIPDQSIPIKELLARNQRGLPLAGKQPIFNLTHDAPESEAYDLPVNRTLDLVERQELMEANQQRQQELKQQLHLIEMDRKQTAERKAAEAEKAQYEKFKNFLKEGESKEKP